VNDKVKFYLKHAVLIDIIVSFSVGAAGYLAIKLFLEK
jgi:hypothetical protein